MLSALEKQRLKHYAATDSQRLTEIFDALSDNNRCQLFRIFTRQTDLNVGEIAQLMDMSLPLVSQHLKILERSGLLVRKKTGREVFYRVNEADGHVQALVKAILT